MNMKSLTRKTLISGGIFVGTLFLAGCSSWQEDEPSHTYSSSHRTSAAGPVAFRSVNEGSSDRSVYERGRSHDYLYADSRQPGYGGGSAGYSRYSSWGQVEAESTAPQTERSQLRDPLERQWNSLRQSQTRARPRWNSSSSEFMDPGQGWNSQDNIALLRERYQSGGTSRGESSTTRRSTGSGFSLDYERLAPGSQLAKEARQQKEQELRLAEERRQQRQRGEESPVLQRERVGTDLPRAPELDNSGRIESLREIARQELKPDLTRQSGASDNASLIPASSLYSRNSRINFAQLLGQKDPISLRNSYARTQIPVNISPRLKVDEWTMRLVYTHSTSIVPHQSQIVVSLDQVVVAQIEMVPDQPYNSVEIPLPRDLARGRNHEFQIAVSQPLPANASTYTGGPERFTQIDLEQSYLEVKGYLEPIPARLSEFQHLFDYSMISGQYPVHFCIPGSSNMIKEYLEWGAIVAQGVGLRVSGAPLRLSHGERLRANQDNILIGDVASLAPFLEGDLARSVKGPFMAIQPLYRDDRHFLIVLGGRNDEEVRLAVEAFAVSPDTLPDTSFFGVTELQLNMKAGMIPVGQPSVRIPGDYAFSELGAYSQTMDELPGSEYTLDLFLPGNYLPNREKDAILEVHFTHSGQDADRSYLQVFVGNLFVGDISLSQASEGSYRKRTLALPPQALRPGHNQIRLVNRSAALNAVGQVYPRSNPLTILDSSRVVIPAAVGARQLPDLSLMARSGFPLTDLHNPGDLTVYITDGDPRTVDSAWTFLAKVAQVSGSYLHGVDLTFTPPEGPRNMLVMGLWQQLSDKWHEGAPLFSGRGSLEYRTSRRNTFADEVQSKSLFEQFQQKVEGAPASPQAAPGVHSMRIGIGGDIPENVIVAQYENPVRRGYLVTMMAAASPEALYDGVLSLQEPVVWNSMHGEMMMLAAGNKSQASFSPALDRFAYRGEQDMVRAVVPMIWGDTWIQVFIILGALVLLALGTAIWIRKASPASYAGQVREDEEI